jgi:hypothetical protein
MKKNINWITLLSLLAFSVLTGYVVYFLSNADYQSGDLIRPYSQSDTQSKFSEILRVDLNNLITNYDDQIKLISSVFGFIAFLISYQAKNKISISSVSWGVLCFGVIVLSASLVFCILGKDLLITMLIRNSVKLSLNALTISRQINIVCIVISTISFGFYTIKLAQNISSYKFINPEKNQDEEN